MPKQNTCTSCGKVYTGKVYREFTTGIKHFTCSNCKIENTIPLSKGGRILNNTIMVIFGILSIIALSTTSWSSGGFVGLLGSLTGNAIVFIPFIFSFLSFLGHHILIASKNMTYGPKEVNRNEDRDVRHSSNEYGPVEENNASEQPTSSQKVFVRIFNYSMLTVVLVFLIYILDK